MKFDNIFGNPPFQDNENRKKTQHKLWIEFTTKAMYEWLEDDGNLLWITPQSWQSPSNKILKMFKQKNTSYIDLDIASYFPDIGSSFSYYHVINNDTSNKTKIKSDNSFFTLTFDDDLVYLPNDFCEESYSIHNKVMFAEVDKYTVNYDYVTCHNVIRHKKTILAKKINKIQSDLKTTQSNADASPSKVAKLNERLAKFQQQLQDAVITVSETKTSEHIYPLLHTNKKTWFSSIKQSFSDEKKVMWSRSGYTKPFYDNGKLGCTDMGYYILVDSDIEGQRLEKFLNSKLMKYIFTTAKWSGFGNELVFSNIPKIDLSIDYTDEDYFDLFGLSADEKSYINNFSSKKTKKSSNKKSETKSDKRIKSLGEVYTPAGLVNLMLNHVDVRDWKDPSKTFLDPACGNGNFLVEILKKRLENNINPKDAVSTLYGIDIMDDNIRDCKKRILDVLQNHNAATKEIQDIIDLNIIVANTLKLKQLF
jgi:hypothetical protein